MELKGRQSQFFLLQTKGKLNVRKNGHINCGSNKQMSLEPEAARVMITITKHATWCDMRR
jgi:hypothetical protein